MKRIILTVGLGWVLALAFFVPALAGGWAVITLDALPVDVVAGEPFEVGFVVRQHGIRPLGGLTAVILARPQGSVKVRTFTSEEKGNEGHYVATVTLPEAGQWEWSIDAFSGNQPMPMLTVATAAPSADTSSRPAASIPAQWPQQVMGLLGAVGILAGLVVILRQKARWAIALVLAGLVVSAGSIVLAADQSQVNSDAQIKYVDSPVSQVELGRQLFIAKGCMLCHSHSETNKIREFGVDIGPDLTTFTGSPEYLRIWLKDPLEAKSTAQMPQLELKEWEIEALIAFINSD